MSPFNLESVVKYLNHCRQNYNPVEQSDLCLSVALSEILERLKTLEEAIKDKPSDPVIKTKKNKS